MLSIRRPNKLIILVNWSVIHSDRLAIFYSRVYLLVYIKNIKVSCNPLGVFFRVVSGYMKLKYTFKTDQLSFFSRGGHIL